MQYQQHRNLKQTFVDVLNKVFKNTSQWLNTDVEVIAVSGDNSPDVFEQYPWDNEKYPRVIVFAGNAAADKWAIDSKICQVRDNIEFGTAARSSTQITTSPIGFAVSSPELPLKLHSISAGLQYIGPYEEDIAVELWSATSGPAPVPTTKLASGSFKGQQFGSIQEMTVGIRPIITLAPDINYFIVFRAAGSYNLMVDTAPVDAPNTRFLTYTNGSWAETSTSQTFVGTINGAAYQRLGGGISTGLRIFTEAKDLATVQKISDLIFVYLNLVRHSNPSRPAKLTDPNQTNTLYEFVSDLTDSGIYVMDVNKGAEAVRERGNDRIWSIDVDLTCYSHWTEDFSMPDLEDIDTDINKF